MVLLIARINRDAKAMNGYRVTSLIRNRHTLGSYGRPIHSTLKWS